MNQELWNDTVLCLLVDKFTMYHEDRIDDFSYMNDINLSKIPTPNTSRDKELKNSNLFYKKKKEILRKVEDDYIRSEELWI